MYITGALFVAVAFIVTQFSLETAAVAAGPSKPAMFAQPVVPPVTTFMDLSPATPDGEAGWYLTQPEIFLYGNQPGRTYYQWDSTADGGWAVAESLVGVPQGEHVLHYFSTSQLGGTTGDVRSAFFRIDSVRPVGSVTTDAEAKFVLPGRVSALLQANDGDGSGSGSGVTHFRVSPDGKAWGSWMPFAGEASWALPSQSPANGRQKAYAQVRDAAGGISPTLTATALVDGRVPYLKIVGPGDSKGRVTVRKPSIEFRVYDRQSGLTTDGAKIVVDGKALKWKAGKSFLKGGLIRYRLPKALRKGRHCASVAAIDRMGARSVTKKCFKVMGAINAPGHNQASRHGQKPKVIVMHATAGAWPGDYKTLRGLTGRRVSSHIYIRRNGTVYRIVPDWRSAWHAGSSSWRGKQVNGSINSISLGIELESRDASRASYTPAQTEAAAEVVKTWMKKYKIGKKNVVSHAQIAPRRKVDPRYLDWKLFWKSVKTS